MFYRMFNDIFSKLRELNVHCEVIKFGVVTGKEELVIIAWGVFQGEDNENDLKSVEVMAMKLQILLKSF